MKKQKNSFLLKGLVALLREEGLLSMEEQVKLMTRLQEEKTT